MSGQKITVPVPEPGRVVILVHDLTTGVLVTGAIRRLAAFAKAFGESWNMVAETMDEMPEDDTQVSDEVKQAYVAKVSEASASHFLGLSQYVQEELYPGTDGPAQFMADIASLLTIGVKSPEEMGAKLSGTDITGGGPPRKGH